MKSKRVWKTMICVSLILVNCLTYGQKLTYDLAIKNVRVFDSITKKVYSNRTILINADTIVSIASSSRNIEAGKTIDGNKRLVVPGFIDSHTHLRNVFGALDEGEKGPVALNRKKLTEIYLRHGTTTIVDMGQPEKWMDTAFAWQMNPLPDYPNIYISGGAIVSFEEGRKTYMNHVVVNSQEDAKAKVQEYASKGLRHTKIYWRLRDPEMRAIIAEGKKNNMTLSAHIDNNVTSISDAIDLGVKNFEHMLSLPPAILVLNDHRRLLREKYGLGDADNSDKFLAQILFYFDYIKGNPEWDAKLEALFDKMAKNDATLSTAIHILGSVAEKTYFFTSLTLNSKALDLSGYSAAQKDRLGKGFDLMMHYLKIAHDKGVKIRIGTDCQDGGQALLSELLLMSEAGFSAEDILQIATINGARAMNIDRRYGSIQTGKVADLILFEKDPLENSKNFLSKKLIIKSGKVLE